MPFSLKVDNFRQVQTSLKAADPALQKQFSKELRGLTAKSVAEARSLASWSTKIPPSIKPMVGVRQAGIRVAAKPSPLGVLNERKSGKWRHPVFGNKNVWRDQTAKPSVRPVVEKNRLEFKIAAEKAARAALDEAGLRK